MAPYWLWRAIGGSLMWLSHILFAYNFYKMIKRNDDIIIPTSATDILRAKKELEQQELDNQSLTN